VKSQKSIKESYKGTESVGSWRDLVARSPQAAGFACGGGGGEDDEMREPRLRDEELLCGF
jgi:hypothetical protein